MIYFNPLYDFENWNEEQMAFLHSYFLWSKDEDRSIENCAHILNSFFCAFPCHNRKDFCYMLMKLSFSDDPNEIDRLCDILDQQTETLRGNKDLESYLKSFPADTLKCESYLTDFF